MTIKNPNIKRLTMNLLISVPPLKDSDFTQKDPAHTTERGLLSLIKATGAFP
jgi:hypothetical protein